MRSDAGRARGPRTRANPQGRRGRPPASPAPGGGRAARLDLAQQLGALPVQQRKVPAAAAEQQEAPVAREVQRVRAQVRQRQVERLARRALLRFAHKRRLRRRCSQSRPAPHQPCSRSAPPCPCIPARPALLSSRAADCPTSGAPLAAQSAHDARPLTCATSSQRPAAFWPQQHAKRRRAAHRPRRQARRPGRGEGAAPAAAARCAPCPPPPARRARWAAATRPPWRPAPRPRPPGAPRSASGCAASCRVCAASQPAARARTWRAARPRGSHAPCAGQVGSCGYMCRRLFMQTGPCTGAC